MKNKIFLFFLLTACQSNPSLVSPRASSQDLLPPPGVQVAKVTPLEISGENCCAQWMGQKSQIIFLSRKRVRHSHFQVYVYDLDLKKERRLTFHDGDDQGPQLDSTSGEVFYASTTDSLKENPRFLMNTLGRAVPPLANTTSPRLWTVENFELYRSKKDGTNIQRLTTDAGFDGELSLHPKGHFLIYSSVREGLSRLVRLDLNSRSQRLLTRVKEAESDPALSFNGKELAWVRTALDQTSSQIWIANLEGTKARALTSGEGFRATPAWSPDGKYILFSSNYETPDNFELYGIQKDGSCLTRLTYSAGQDLVPAWAPDGQSLIFSSNRGGSFQLYTQPWTPPSCPSS